MPIKGEIKENLLKEIKETEQPEKLRLVGLYKQLHRIYEKDDEYSRNTTAFAFETHEKLRNLSTKAMQIIKNEEPINEAELADKRIIPIAPAAPSNTPSVLRRVIGLRRTMLAIIITRIGFEVIIIAAFSGEVISRPLKKKS